MKTTQRPRAARNLGQAVAVAVLIAGTTLLGASPRTPTTARASARYGGDVGTARSVDPGDPDLKMPEGGTARPGRVLDIVR